MEPGTETFDVEGIREGHKKEAGHSGLERRVLRIAILLGRGKLKWTEAEAQRLEESPLQLWLAEGSPLRYILSQLKL